MDTLKILNNKLDFDDVCKSHASIVTEATTVTSSIIYDAMVSQLKSTYLKINVSAKNLGEFVKELVDEVKMRKEYIMGQCDKIRLSDVADTNGFEPSYIIMQLPRTLTNKNIHILKDLLSYSTTLGIHLILLIPDDASERVKTLSESTFWLLDLAQKELTHKAM